MPNSVDQRLLRTTSQAVPSVQKATNFPCHAVNVRYPDKAMPRTARTKSGQLGPSRRSDLAGACLLFLFLSLAIELSFHQSVYVIFQAHECFRLSWILIAADACLTV